MESFARTLAVVATLVMLCSLPLFAQGIVASNLPVEIRGIITSKDPQGSVALLQDTEQGKLAAVKPGYSLLGGQAVVRSIDKGTVIIERMPEKKLEYIGKKPASAN